MNIAEKLIRPELKELVPYESARRIGGNGDVWLNANENPYAHEYELDCSQLNRYPEFQPPAVINGYADYAGVATNQVLATRGADESIELLIRTFCRPGQDQIMICPPTYGMYAISAQTNAINVNKVVLDDAFQPDVEAIKTADAESALTTKVVFLCSPNNPTGHSVEPARLSALLDYFAGRALVVVDEAYIEFSDAESVVALLDSYPQLVILRTLSKAFALAGIRCGFTLASPEIIQALSKVIAPYPLPEPVAQLAAQALSASGIAQMRSEVSQLKTARNQLYQRLQQQGFSVQPSTGNFLLFTVNDASTVMQAAAAQGIVLRDQSKQPKLTNCLRITIGSATELNRFNALIEALVEEV